MVIGDGFSVERQRHGRRLYLTAGAEWTPKPIQAGVFADVSTLIKVLASAERIEMVDGKNGS